MTLRLRSLTAQNYKSLRQCKVEPREITVLLGANGVGKSNIFDAFRFIKDRVEKSFESALNDRSGIESCTWRGFSQRASGFNLKIDFDDSLEYSLTSGILRTGGFGITHERLGPTSDGKPWVETRDGQITFYLSDNSSVSQSVDSVSLKGYGTHQKSPEAVRRFVEHVQGWQFYNFMPFLMRSPNPARKEQNLDEYGRNFSSWLHNIQSRHRQTFEDVVAVLRDGIETARDLGSELTDNSAVSMFLEEQGLEGTLPLGAFSDGTLRFLAHIAVLRQPVPPTMLFLEEPENYLHPRLIEKLSEEIRAAGLHFPILINTHNPLFVDKFEPWMIVIVERGKEGTITVPVDSREDLQKLIREMELELGEIWYSGALGGVRSSLD